MRPILHFLALLAVPAAALVARPPPRLPARHRGHVRMVTGFKPERQLAEQLERVRSIRPAEQSKEVQASLWAAAGLNPTYKVSGTITGEPSFTRLFSHADWRYYTGKSPIRRWSRIIVTWKYSTVLRALWPISLSAAIWAFLIASLPGTMLPRTSPVPMSLFGQALGLLLVFRTNNT